MISHVRKFGPGEHAARVRVFDVAVIGLAGFLIGFFVAIAFFHSDVRLHNRPLWKYDSLFLPPGTQ